MISPITRAVSIPQNTPTRMGTWKVLVIRAEVYAPIAIKPAWPMENRPVNPVRMETPRIAII